MVCITVNPIIKRIRTYFSDNSPNQANMLSWYIMSLILPTDKHSLSWAQRISKRSKSSFSRLLGSLHGISQDLLNNSLSKLIPEIRRPIVSGSPWTVAIIIDSTIYNRASRKTDNSQKFNHGKGFQNGHQLTNIVLWINGEIFPLPPLMFYTKAYCKKHNIKYQTEHMRVRNYLSDLNLKVLLGSYKNSEILVLSDSGYDDRKIYKCCVSRGWDFIGSLKSGSTADLENPLENGPIQVMKLFRMTDSGLWKTVHTYLNGKSRKRKDFRACALQGLLNGHLHPVQLVCSEPRRERRKKRKYLVCSNCKVDVGIVVRAYRLRWSVEVFHKEVKSNLGFQDGSFHKVGSIEVHVHLVYLSYLLLKDLVPNSSSVQQSCYTIAEEFNKQPYRDILSLSGRFVAVKSIKARCFEELQAA